MISYTVFLALVFYKILFEISQKWKLYTALSRAVQIRPKVVQDEILQ